MIIGKETFKMPEEELVFQRITELRQDIDNLRLQNSILLRITARTLQHLNPELLEDLKPVLDYLNISYAPQNKATTTLSENALPNDIFNDDVTPTYNEPLSDDSNTMHI